MKKILAILAIVSCAGAVYAAQPTWQAQTGGGGITAGTTVTTVFKPSANVHMAYGGVNGTVYTIGTYHESGNRAFGTSSTETTLYYTELGTSPGATGTVTQIPDPATPTYGTGWTSVK